MTIKQDIQKLEPGALLELFDIDATALGGTINRFHAGTNSLRTAVVWQGNTYNPWPIDATGFDISGKGQLPTPHLKVANIGGLVTALALAYDDLIGAKVTRRRTFAKYLDAANFIEQPALDIKFTAGSAVPIAGEPSLPLTCTRTGTATRVNAQGLLETVAANTLRLNYNPVTLACRGLLSEETRTNLALQSADISSAAWGNENVTVVGNQLAAPDGAVAMGSLTENVALGYHRIWLGSNQPRNANYAWSVFIKRKAGTHGIGLQLTTGGANNLWQNFNIDTGTAQGAPIVSGDAVFAEAGIEDWGNGIYRVWIAGKPSATDSANGVSGYVYMMDGTWSNSFTGDGTSAVYAWGGQLEAGAFPTSYIPTGVAAVTRGVETVMANNISSFYLAAGGTLYTEIEANHPAAGQIECAAGFTNTGSVASRINHLVNAAPNDEFSVVDTNTFQANLGGGVTITKGMIVRQASAFVANDFATSTNAGAVATDTAGTIPTVTRLGLGCLAPESPWPLNGHLRRVTYYPTRHSNADLQTFSTSGPIAYTGVADPTAEFPLDIFYVERKVSENRAIVEFELAAASDVEGVLLPRRQVIANVCSWTYRSSECSYAGGAVAQADDTPTTNINLDVCGKRVSSCKLRFGALAELPYGGFPGSRVTA